MLRKRWLDRILIAIAGWFPLGWFWMPLDDGIEFTSSILVGREAVSRLRTNAQFANCSRQCENKLDRLASGSRNVVNPGAGQAKKKAKRWTRCLIGRRWSTHGHTERRRTEPNQVVVQRRAGDNSQQRHLQATIRSSVVSRSKEATIRSTAASRSKQANKETKRTKHSNSNSNSNTHSVSRCLIPPWR